MALFLVLGFLFGGVSSATTTVSFAPGAYIIDMGSFPYTQATGLKPYGLVYDLVINKLVPVSWAINPAKSYGGVDFTATTGAGTKGYRGGSLIVPQEYASLALSTINTWKAKGVIVDGPTTAPFSAQIYDNITSFPNAVCDLQNGALIIAAFYTPSEVPTSSYRLGSPSDLNDCDDIYAMPHADPQGWTALEKSTFYNFIDHGGDLWAACHAVSALEAPAPTYLGWYFLSTNGLIPWGSHKDPVPPYTYNASAATHPVMQFLGRLDNALLSGSEQVYLPRIGSSWRGTSTVAVWDPDQADVVAGLSPGLAGIVIYGYAFGNTSKGFIVYEASHRFTTGNVSENVDAARVYGNFLLYSGIMHKIYLAGYVPAKMLSGSVGPVNVSVSVGSTGTPPYTVKWSSSCGGTFANSTAFSTTFTAPTVTSVTPCTITAIVTDKCGRRNFMSKPVTIYPVMMTLQKTDYKQAVQQEELLPYRIYYNNTGPITAENVIITDLLPDKVTYNPTAYPAPYSVTYNPNLTTTLVWHLGNVSGGEKRKILLNATVKPGISSGSIINNVKADSYISGLGPIYKYAQDIDVLSPITKSVNRTTASAGDYLNYSICARYDEPYLLKNATVKDTIPDYTTYVANSTTAGGVYFAGNKTIVWELGSNEPGISSQTKPGTNTVNIPATYDTYTSSGGNADKNYGASTTLQMSTSNSRALLYFSVSSIPPAATINSASFYAYFSTAVNGATVNIYNMSKYWCAQADQCSCTGKIAEGSVCNVEPNSLATGRGAVWGYYSYNKNAPSCAWTTAGGDYDAGTSYGTFVPNTAGVYANATVTSLVSGWKGGSILNRGILLEYNQDLGGNPVEFASKETGGTASDPYLLVFYSGATGSPLKIYPSYDTYVRQDDALKNFGSCTYLRLNGARSSKVRHPMLYFDISGIPSAAIISRAYLNLYVNTAGSALGTATVRSMTRYWCTQATSCQCQGLVVEGKLNGAVPDTVAEGYGATWNNYMYNGKSTACAWNTLGGDYYTTTTRGTIPLSNTTAGWWSGSVTALVQGWYGGTIPVQGIALTSTSGTPVIQSREGTNKPYLRVTYNVGQGTNNSLIARPLLSCEGGQIEVKMTVNTSANDTTITAPANLNVDAYNATITLASGPTPASYSNVPALSNRTFTYVYNLQTTGYSGNVAFSGKPATPTYYATATSNRLLVTPSLSYTVRINPYPATPNTVNSINNTARFMDEAVIPSGVDSNEVITNLIWPRNIQVTKSADISQGVKCNNVNFSLAVKNTGLARLVTVEVVDTLPTGIEYISSPNGSINGQIITWADIGSMNPGQTKTLTFVGHITGEAFGNLNNIVQVKGTTINGNNVTNSSSYVVKALKTDISGTKIPDMLEGPPSTTINFTVNMTNSGEATLAPATMTDIFPHGMEYVSATPVPNSSDAPNHTFIWSWPSLAPGATKTVVMKVHLNGEYFGEICNPVVLIGKTPSGLYVNNQTFGCVNVQEPGIALNKSSDFATGDRCNINYSLNVTNTGEVTLDPVTLVDWLPAGLQYISSNGSIVGSTITWTGTGPLPAGRSRTFYVLAKINHSAEGLQSNKANVTANSSTGYSYSAEDYENLTAHAVAMEVSKGAMPKEAVMNQNVTFTINITNKGNCTLNTVAVIDVLPLGLTYLSDNRSGFAAGGTVSWADVGPLAPGAYTNISLVTYVDGAASGDLKNMVTATGSPEVGCDVTASDEENVTVFAKTDFVISKTASPDPAEPGDNVTFIINVTNTGEVALPTVRVVDVLPVGMVYIWDNSTPPGNVSGNLITWDNVGPIAAGASKYIKMFAQVVL
jgi:uncharacterized repeat protein (TIGR01451 family)